MAPPTQAPAVIDGVNGGTCPPPAFPGMLSGLSMVPVQMHNRLSNATEHDQVRERTEAHVCPTQTFDHVPGIKSKTCWLLRDGEREAQCFPSCSAAARCLHGQSFEGNIHGARMRKARMISETGSAAGRYQGPCGTQYSVYAHDPSEQCPHRKRSKPNGGAGHKVGNFANGEPGRSGPADVQQYAVEAILGERIEGGQPRYLVKWVGYGEEHNTWEPRSNLADCTVFLAHVRNTATTPAPAPAPASVYTSLGSQGKGKRTGTGAVASKHSSVYKGVSWNKARSHWEAGAWHQGRNHHCPGWFDEEEEAARAADAMARKVGKQVVNFPQNASETAANLAATIKGGHAAKRARAFATADILELGAAVPSTTRVAAGSSAFWVPGSARHTAYIAPVASASGNVAYLNDGTPLFEGDVVQAHWRGGQRLCSATITYIHENCTLDISYHDHDCGHEQGVSVANIDIQPTSQRSRRRSAKKSVTNEPPAPQQHAPSRAGARPPLKFPGDNGDAQKRNNEERERKSNFYQSLKPGAVVTLVQNNRPGHHDVTRKDKSLEGAQAIVVEAPVYPNTWLSVKLKDAPGQVIKVRTSQLSQYYPKLAARLGATASPTHTSQDASPESDVDSCTDSETDSDSDSDSSDSQEGEGDAEGEGEGGADEDGVASTGNTGGDDRGYTAAEDELIVAHALAYLMGRRPTGAADTAETATVTLHAAGAGGSMNMHVPKAWWQTIDLTGPVWKQRTALSVLCRYAFLKAQLRRRLEQQGGDGSDAAEGDCGEDDEDDNGDYNDDNDDNDDNNNDDNNDSDSDDDYDDNDSDDDNDDNNREAEDVGNNNDTRNSAHAKRKAAAPTNLYERAGVTMDYPAADAKRRRTSASTPSGHAVTTADATTTATSLTIGSTSDGGGSGGNINSTGPATCGCKTPNHQDTLFCDGCDEAFPLCCTGLVAVPQGDEEWLCAVCSSSGSHPA